MSTFTPKEIFVSLCIGTGALVLGIAMAITGAVCLRNGIGVPEYIISLRNTGLTFIILSILWIGLAAWRQLPLK